ncbi:protein RIC-3b isoform X3 [Sphaeramia orbicularis]|uniref:protein RIC-3b isoform X2 n=1 Tax=Sphaeramia orbicularis TaxID=375764 RepID=UPI00117E13EE|nr:protein RIC-3-like isoform X2 [Sphaeramia orbicularis]XP_029993101.1 protein RIC-3-like isoform X3 [Sphaeramia orbicularis]
MAMSAFQKVTLVTCLVLCVALLLPKMLLSRGRKDAERPEGAGRFPPMMHRQMAPEGRGQRGAGSGFSRAHNSEAIARVKGSGSGTGTGAGTGGKSNLAGQIIPVYGFGILLYILYILFKITSKGSSKPAEGRTPSTRTENMKRKITDYELAQLQEKLRETELVMENIVSNAHHSPDRLKGVTLDQEESLLLQLTEITRVMQEGQLVDAVAPQKKKGHDQWEDYPEEPRPYWEHSHCCCQHSQQDQSESTTERTQGDGADGVQAGTDGAESSAEGAETGAEDAMSGGQMDEDDSTDAEKTESEITSGPVDKHEQEEGGGKQRVQEEDRRVQEKDLKVQEEDLRVQEEDLRVQEEDLKVQEEDRRVQEEDWRVQVKDLKVQEEDLRVQEEDRRVQEEDPRIQEQDPMVQEEDRRVQKEDLRAQEEDLRVQEEDLRVQEDDLRVQEDDLRVQEEDQRVQEEDQRVQESDLAGVLQDVVKPAQTESSISHVRRRNRRRRTKKDLN